RWPKRSSAGSSRTTTLSRYSATPSSARSVRASRPPNGGTCSRQSPLLTPIPGETFSSRTSALVGVALSKEERMEETVLTRRKLLRTAAMATTALATPFVRSARATATVAPKGKMVLAWHTNIAARWLDPQQHDGTASGDNFLMALH